MLTQASTPSRRTEVEASPSSRAAFGGREETGRAPLKGYPSLYRKLCVYISPAGFSIRSPLSPQALFTLSPFSGHQFLVPTGELAGGSCCRHYLPLSPHSWLAMRPHLAQGALAGPHCELRSLIPHRTLLSTRPLHFTLDLLAREETDHSHCLPGAFC